MKGNYCEGLRPQLEAVQVCLGQLDVCAGGIGVGQKTDMCMPTAPLTAVLMQSGV